MFHGILVFVQCFNSTRSFTRNVKTAVLVHELYSRLLLNFRPPSTNTPINNLHLLYIIAVTTSCTHASNVCLVNLVYISSTYMCRLEYFYHLQICSIVFDDPPPLAGAKWKIKGFLMVLSDDTIALMPPKLSCDYRRNQKETKRSISPKNVNVLKFWTKRAHSRWKLIFFLIMP